MTGLAPRLIFLTHPQVIIDPEKDIRRWSLSPMGRSRMEVFARSPDAARITAIWSSTETKAQEAAAVLSAALGVSVDADAGLGENDRSATGFLPPAAFEAAADAFFARPDHSFRGWETAVSAQSRIAAALHRILAGHNGGDLAVVSHGAVGTLMLCRLLNMPISRALDQPSQGHYWAATLPGLELLHRWQPIDSP